MIVSENVIDSCVGMVTPGKAPIKSADSGINKNGKGESMETPLRDGFMKTSTNRSTIKQSVSEYID